MDDMNPTNQTQQAPLLKRLNWPLVAALAVVALVRPLFSIVGLTETLGKPVTPIVLTVVISATWVLAVGLSRVSEPLLTLVATGLAYAVAAVVLSAVLSPILTGELQGPIVNPFGLVAMFVTNAIWGALCGVLAMGLQRLRR